MNLYEIVPFMQMECPFMEMMEIMEVYWSKVWEPCLKLI